jgi:DNA-binding response OmpR family regulator
MATGKDSILIIAADRGLAESVAKLLREFGYGVTVTQSVTGGLAEACRIKPALILLDGHESFVPTLRQDVGLRRVPIIALYPQGTNCESECNDILAAGVDAVLCKPVSPRELVARIRAILRRKSFQPATDPLFIVGGLRVDVGRHEVTVNGRPVELTHKEFQILQQLAQRPDRVFGRDELLTLVWGEGAALEEHNLDVHVHSLRRKIEADPAHPRFILTVRGVGYKLKSGSS